MKWANENDMKNILKKINRKEEIEKSGLPLMYDDKNIYINDKEGHSLIIGSTGSGKTQTTILPKIKLSMLAGESIIVNDVKGEIYNKYANLLEEYGYKTYVLDFDNLSLGNSWNPLTLPYQLYKEGNKDKALELVEDLAYYLLYAKEEKNTDPFWSNTAIDYFTGMTLFLFENAKENEININSVYNISNMDKDILLSKIDKNSTIYYCVTATLNAPKDTRGSILAVYNQKLKQYVSRENLTNMLSYNDFDIKNISNEKTAIFIVSGSSTFANNLIPLFITQTIKTTELYGNHEKTLNILLDEFESLLPIKNFAKLITYSRSININFIVVVSSLIELVNTYGEEKYELLKMCFSNIIYLLSNDIYTLKEISNLCGNTTNNGISVPLITVEELKLFNYFEAIVLMPRVLPFKTKLLPDYQYQDGLTYTNKEIPKRNINEVNIFEL